LKKDAGDFPRTFWSQLSGIKEGKQMVGNALQTSAWKTVAALLLTSIPLAERMLIYHLATTALILLPLRPFTDQ
jgi:hypothetical protein